MPEIEKNINMFRNGFREKKRSPLKWGLQDFDKKDKKDLGISHRTLKRLLQEYRTHLVLAVCMVHLIKPIHRKGQILHVDVNNYYHQC